MTPRTIRGRPQSAAPCCQRIELVPSRRFAAVWLAWLLLAGALVWAAGGLHGWLRLACIAAVWLPGLAVLRRVLWLRGSSAVDAVEWAPPGAFRVRLAGSGRRLAAVPDPGCQCFGPWVWILRFETSEGALLVIVDPRAQDPRAIRALSRSLGWGSGRGS